MAVSVFTTLQSIYMLYTVILTSVGATVAVGVIVYKTRSRKRGNTVKASISSMLPIFPTVKYCYPYELNTCVIHTCCLRIQDKISENR